MSQIVKPLLENVVARIKLEGAPCELTKATIHYRHLIEEPVVVSKPINAVGCRIS